MPMQRELYPDDWDAIAMRVKDAAGWVCQRCGMQCRKPGEPFDTHRRTMSVMHLDHNPANCVADNLCAACSKCHLVYDAPHHAKNAAHTRRQQKIDAGQTELFP